MGPGDYNTMNIDNNRMRTSIKFSIGNSKRDEITINRNSPGPGNYEITLANKKRGANYGIGTAPRDAYSLKTVDSPGPGNYAIAGLIGKGGSQSSMHAKILIKSPSA